MTTRRHQAGGVRGKGPLEPGPFNYVAGAGATATVNRHAFDRWAIVPRMPTDATQRDLSTTVLGTRLPFL
jgi:isopentenyl diphosphate isomerase/L-lactate dehydrogenase-like FMN-dependent dehydrogenase